MVQSVENGVMKRPPLQAISVPLMNSGAGVIGTSGRFADAGHVHPTILAGSDTALLTLTKDNGGGGTETRLREVG